MQFLKKHVIDIHGMMELEARKKLEREIIKLHKAGYRRITVIHGYREGTVLKEMVLKGLRSKLIDKRIQNIFNLGETDLILKEK